MANPPQRSETRGRMSPEPRISLRSYTRPPTPMWCLPVGVGADRTGAERGALGHALGLVQSYCLLAQRVIRRVADDPDRRDQPVKHQRLAVMYCGI
jgi:hypothetical protein